ncbi:MAG: DEAD/DEAH box helicase [Gracilibacteraceae bacterium]|jgi:non-specific serine/threonine protein kinase|nr:DEAD/DEAH box helicase [Gracilibacteraceae bacterium]
MAKNQNRELIACYLERGAQLDYAPTADKNAYTNDQLYRSFKNNPYKALLYFGFDGGAENMPPSLAYIHSIAQRFILALSQDADIEITRRAAPLSEDDLAEMRLRVPFALGAEHVNFSWIGALWQGLATAFAREIAGVPSIAEFLTAHRPGIKVVGRVFFHLVESKDEEYPFAFLATYSTAADEEQKAAHVPLKNALLEYKGQSAPLLKLLTAVSRAADKSELISELTESGELFLPLKFTAAEAYTFLKEIPLYEECGILCRIPAWWKKRAGALKLSVSIGDRPPTRVGMEALLSFDPAIYFGGEKLSKEDVAALLAQTAGLSYIKGKWVEVDHDRLQAVLTAYEEVAGRGEMTFAEFVHMQLGLSGRGKAAPDSDILEVTNGEWLAGVRDKLLHPARLEALPLGGDFKATLRHYQQKGADWLYLMKNLGFGALLADDMGLGKTVQILALLEYMRQNGDFRALLIVPASLIGNWEGEINRFAPKLRYTVVHAGHGDLAEDGWELCITTYGMAPRLEFLQAYRWDALILDEAQAIKNPATKQTKAVKQLKAGFKIALTGTPIENRLSDLWSLFDFLNAGFLGTAKEFSAFSKGQKDYAKLRDAVAPFILRRLKTDKAIISDLPDKIEIKAYAGLTKKQAVLYRELVSGLAGQLETAEGIGRKGLVLAAIMKFKQICNHPDQYLGGAGFEAAHSGKFEKLEEICETIREKRERALIFTQFKEMTEPLAEFLGGLWGKKGLVLHGETPAKKRTELVKKFCGAEYVPFMVLSLKAGGVGLNLTSANHVIHFDRWWNPAVENQATDRAFRIGQTKNVLVHKMITTGTIEEKIDLMIAEKQKLAGDILADSGEKWITEMSNDELLNLFRLA